MQMEIKLRPPYQISMGELGSANGVTSAFSVDYKGAGKISSGEFWISITSLKKYFLRTEGLLKNELIYSKILKQVHERM